MALWRKVSMEFWRDPWVEDLDSKALLLLLYLITSEASSPSGLYEIATKRMAYDTRLSEDRILAILADFEEAEQVYYDQETKLVWCKLLREYNERGNDQVQRRINLDIADAPESPVKAKYLKHYALLMRVPEPKHGRLADDSTTERKRSDNASLTGEQSRPRVRPRERAESDRTCCRHKCAFRHFPPCPR